MDGRAQWQFQDASLCSSPLSGCEQDEERLGVVHRSRVVGLESLARLRALLFRCTNKQSLTLLDITLEQHKPSGKVL